MLQLLGSKPRDHGQPRSRWTLDGLGAAVPEFAGASRAGILRVQAKYKLRRKRWRDHLHSPDPRYQEKVSYLRTVKARVAAAAGAAVLLYGDEVTSYRQPSLGYGYTEAGTAGPRAERSPRSNSTTRMIGALVRDFLARFKRPSDELLRYVGLQKAPHEKLNLHQSTAHVRIRHVRRTIPMAQRRGHPVAPIAARAGGARCPRSRPSSSTWTARWSIRSTPTCSPGERRWNRPASNWPSGASTGGSA